MWRTVNVNVTINSDGSITLTNSSSSDGYFNQYINSSGQQTSVLKVEILSGTAYHYVDGSDIGQQKLSTGINVFNPSGDLTQYGIKLAAGSSIKVYYLDLYLGSTAYDHVPEDRATALMRCQQYLRAGYYIGSCIFSYSDGKKLFSFCYENMKSTVTAKLNIDYYTDRGESHKTTNYSIDSTLNGRITFTLNDTTANAIQNGPVRIYAELSCEP